LKVELPAILPLLYIPSLSIVFFFASFSMPLVLYLNPFPDEQLSLIGILPEQVCHFGSLCVFCLGCKTISRRAARRLIALHHKQGVQIEQKWQTC